MEKFKKSFKSQNPEQSPPRHHNNPEEKLILLRQQDQNDVTSAMATTSSSSLSANDSAAADRKEFAIKISGGDNGVAKESEISQQKASTVWRGSSYDFTQDAAAKGIGDFGFVADSPSPQRSSPLSRIPESPNQYGVLTPRDVRVSFNEVVQRRSNASNGGGHGSGGGEDSTRGGGASGEVVVCSANASFRRKSALLATKSKSRLMDPPEQDQRSQTLGMKSGALGKPGGSEIDDDETLWDEDLPMNYRRMKFSKRTVLELVSLILIIAALVCSLTIPFLRNKKLFELQYWKWELMVLVLICGRMVSGWGIRIAVFFIERNFMLRKRVLYFVYGLKKSVQNCIWLGLVLVAWQWIFDERVERITNGKVLPYVTKIWICLLVGTLVWLLKTLLVKVLASSFHVSTFFDRIQESLFNQYVIETLSGPPTIEIQQEMEEECRVMDEVQKLKNAGATIPPELSANMFLPPKSGRVFSKSDRVIGTPTPRKSTSTTLKSPFSTVMSKKEDVGITIDHLHRLNQKNISAWNMKRLMNIVRKGVLSTTLDEQLQDSTGEDESSVQITSENQAKIAAKKIFNNVAKPGSKHIYLVDVMRFMREDEALKTVRLFEGEGAAGAESRGISKRALKNWVVNAFRERRALALSLNDTKTAVNKLHQMLNVVVGIIIIVIWLLILKVASTHFFIFLSSQLLLVVFVFGNTCKTTFEAIIFLFVMHPFDVGDRCEIDGVQMIVEEMNILTTIFLRYDNQKITYPNSVLSTKPIANYYRSPDMGDAIDFCIHISTPAEKIALMKERIISFIEKKSDHWYPAPMIVVRDVEDLNRLKLSLWPSHRMNHQDMGERWTRRALVVEEMIKVFRELDIEYRLLPLDVNVRNMPALSSTRLPSNWTACAN